MNVLEQQLSYPMGDALPSGGQTLEVAPGIFWLRMQLPFALDHINLWLMRDAQQGQAGWTIVDCGIAHGDNQHHWKTILDRHLQGEPVLRVIVTHMHPDHIGLAHWLCDGWHAPLWISYGDYQTARLACMNQDPFGGTRAADFFAQHGLRDPQALSQVRARVTYYTSMVPSIPPTFHRLVDNQVLHINGQVWRCIVGHGHAPEHMALFGEDAGVLISGDMVLPRISTNVSVYESEPEANSLRCFLDSIDKFKALPADTLTLPSHGKPFRGLHERIDQLHAHHLDRLADVHAACTQAACSAVDVLPVLFKRALDLHQTTFAIGEAVAHLHFLWHQGLLVRSLHADGVVRFASRSA